MTDLARIALKLLTALSSVFIAACYGVAYTGREIGGLVRDARTLAPIPGIRVACLDQGDEASMDVTGPRGEFLMRADCAEFRAEDVDETANGSYATKTVPAAGLDDVVIDLDPLP